MKTSYRVLAVSVFFFVGLYGCGPCRQVKDYFMFIVNTLPQPVTLEVRSRYRPDTERTITLEQEQSSTIFIYRSDSEYHAKSGMCDDHYGIATATMEFSNASLTQYTVCYSKTAPLTYAVLASGTTCTGDYPVQETTGW